MCFLSVGLSLGLCLFNLKTLFNLETLLNLKTLFNLKTLCNVKTLSLALSHCSPVDAGPLQLSIVPSFAPEMPGLVIAPLHCWKTNHSPLDCGSERKIDSILKKSS